MVRLVNESRAAGVSGRRVRILNVLGLRAAESLARSKKTPFGRDPAHWGQAPVIGRPATRRRPAVEPRDGRAHGRREVDRWLPIFSWSTEEVWAEIAASGLTPHPAYALGADRLSCVFCFYAPVTQFVLAARHNIELAREYEAVEVATGFVFRPDGVSMSEIIERAEAEGLIAA
jgi:3'-phosphoadenosine 5'-phosphosulfate sulfotransferase (PAPS reductase)/FAD synthetase